MQRIHLTLNPEILVPISNIAHKCPMASGQFKKTIMPANKNAIIRYKILDDLLSDFHHLYNVSELVTKVNKKLQEDAYPSVCKRTVEMDLNALECDFNAEIERKNIEGKRCIRYAQRGFSIFHKQLSNEEKKLLVEVLTTVGQFEGLSHFNWLDNLQKSLGISNTKPVIRFSYAEALQNSNLLGRLYDSVANEQVIKIRHKKFSSTEEREIIFHPYLIQEYGNRWYLVGKEEGQDFFRNLALDRIIDFTPLPQMKFKPCKMEEINAHYDKSIGITVYPDQETLDILFWVSDLQTHYVETKPAHRSLTKVVDPTELDALRKKYCHADGSFFHIQVQQTYELERALMSHFADIEVLEPSMLRESIQQKVQAMYQLYFP